MQFRAHGGFVLLLDCRCNAPALIRQFGQEHPSQRGDLISAATHHRQRGVIVPTWRGAVAKLTAQCGV